MALGDPFAPSLKACAKAGFRRHDRDRCFAVGSSHLCARVMHKDATRPFDRISLADF
jgi:hypothetical protein